MRKWIKLEKNGPTDLERHGFRSAVLNIRDKIIMLKHLWIWQLETKGRVRKIRNNYYNYKMESFSIEILCPIL